MVRLGMTSQVLWKPGEFGVGEKRSRWSAKGYHMRRKGPGQSSSSAQTMKPNRIWTSSTETPGLKSQNLTVPQYLQVLSAGQMMLLS